LLARSMPALLKMAFHSARVRHAPPRHIARISMENRPAWVQQVQHVVSHGVCACMWVGDAGGLVGP
jgi:hypothetical protein